MIPRILSPRSLCCLLLCGAYCTVPAVAFHVSLHPSKPTTTSSKIRNQEFTSPRVSSVNVEEPIRTLARPKQRTRRVRNNVANAESGGGSDPSSLTFGGQIVKTSRSLVSFAEQDRQRLVDFFKSPEARNTLFVSDAPPVPIDPVSPDIFHAWQAETQRLGAAMPQRSERDTQTVMQLCSNGISFSGLVVETTVICGAKLVHDGSETHNHGLPAYEFTMITDRTQARGPKLLMAIYNKIMGLVSQKEHQKKTTTSICRISLVELDDGVGIDFESSFQVQVKLPSFILKIMPVSKNRAEMQGSSAVTRFVEKGVMESLQRFERTFYESAGIRP